MKPIDFEGSNCIYGENQPEYLPLPAEKRGRYQTGEIVTCWELSPEEIKVVQKTGHIWLSMLTFNQPLQPVCLSTEKPEVYDPVPNQK